MEVYFQASIFWVIEVFPSLGFEILHSVYNDSESSCGKYILASRISKIKKSAGKTLQNSKRPDNQLLNYSD